MRRWSLKLHIYSNSIETKKTSARHSKAGSLKRSQSLLRSTAEKHNTSARMHNASASGAKVLGCEVLAWGGFECVLNIIWCWICQAHQQFVPHIDVWGFSPHWRVGFLFLVLYPRLLLLLPVLPPQHTLTHTHSLTLTHTHTITHTHSHSLTHSHTHTLTLTLTHSHSHSLSLSHSLTHTHSHSLTLTHTHSHSLTLTHSHTQLTQLTQSIYSLPHSLPHSLPPSLTHSLYLNIHTHTHTNSPTYIHTYIHTTIVPPSLSYFLFPSRFLCSV